MPRGKKKDAAPATAANPLQDLLKGLWEAAVALRGSIEPSDYKRYVLPVIFLRFLSLRYERRRAEIEAMVADPKSDHHKDKRAVNDPDLYAMASTFIVPEAARWETLAKNAAQPDVKKRVDDALELLEKTYPDELRGLLPRIFAGSNLDAESLRQLITLFSRETFRRDHGGEDLIGRVYEYFIGEFASSEGKRGGEYFTPASIVRVLVGMLEPRSGTVYDPCCGSGGMFVQSDAFTKHSGHLSFVGQEAKDFTYRLCRMNLFIHGLKGNIVGGRNSYFDDGVPTLKADYVLANPPFNDGSKSADGWGAQRVSDKDPRLTLDGKRIPLAPKNANTFWMLHFLQHLKDGGTAGFVMATGEQSNSQNARLEARKALVDGEHVDAIVSLSGQLFAGTQIPCSLWLLSKNRHGKGGHRKRQGELLFIDARKLGALIPGSRKQKQLTPEEIERIATVYREYKRTGAPKEELGFCRVATLEEVRKNRYALTPGRYVGSPDVEVEEEFEERFPRLVSELRAQMKEARGLEKRIEAALAEVGDV